MAKKKSGHTLDTYISAGMSPQATILIGVSAF
jgi:hypothetical protein